MSDRDEADVLDQIGRLIATHPDHFRFSAAAVARLAPESRTMLLRDMRASLGIGGDVAGTEVAG